VFKLVISDVKSFRNAIDAVVSLIDEGPLEVTKDGLSLRCMDPSQIAMVSFIAPKSFFMKYEVAEPTIVGVNFSELGKMLKRSESGEQLELSQEENMLVAQFTVEHEKRMFRLPLVEVQGGSPKEPAFVHDATVKITAQAFKEGLKDAELISSHVSLEATPENFIIEVRDNSSMRTEMQKGNPKLVELNVKTKARATFPLQYLKDISNAAIDKEPISINLKTNAPVKVSYNIDVLQFTYYLAPRIDAE